VAHFLWFQAVAALAPTRITVLTLLSPLTAAALGWLVLGQSLSPGQLLGAAAVLAAVLLGATARATLPRRTLLRPALPRPALLDATTLAKTTFSTCPAPAEGLRT
jgi:probable blue pigment (indigoidine) exporter